MRLAICDDESVCLSLVTTIAEEYIKEHSHHGIVMESFSDPEDLLEASEKNGGFDIYILDVIMPGMTGIELGKSLREHGYDGKIIYLTSSEEYSLDAFRVKAYDYIIKPICKESFNKIVDEVIAAISEKKDKAMIVKTKERSVKLKYDSIMYAEFNKRIICYFLAGGKTVETLTVRTSFSQAVSELLADKRFTICGQSMIVNLDHITEIENNAVVFGNTYRPFLGEKLCRKLRDTWAEYLFDQEG